jgi:hypothetical protein
VAHGERQNRQKVYCAGALVAAGAAGAAGAFVDGAAGASGADVSDFFWQPINSPTQINPNTAANDNNFFMLG